MTEEAKKPLPLAGEHQYVLWALTAPEDRRRSVCLACGNPPALHGIWPLENARMTFDYENVTRIECESDEGFYP